ncbi:MAG: hypothetical protein CRN43_00970 [Candidatus Nephrothrix sp. EaCA]|nr:MAG: hypothetical protein CRN43_00970 [Candidatus Nephrothrix sp. EaCA]
MKNFIAENLRKLRLKKGLNQADLADLFGKKHNTIGNWENGRAKPDIDDLTKLCNFFAVKLDAFVFEEVDVGKNEEPEEGSEENSEQNIDMVREEGVKFGIPLYPLEAIAADKNIFNMEHDMEELYLVPDFEKAGVEFMLRVKGSAMYPKYNSGDVIGVRKIKDCNFIQWGHLYVLDTEQGTLIKRLFAGKSKDVVICHSDNIQDYPRFEIAISSIRNLYISIGVIRLE